MAIKSDLLINGQDAYQHYGVKMGKDFLNVLLAPLAVKEYVTNEVRDEHGARYEIPTGGPYFQKRSLTLSFVIFAPDPDAFCDLQQAFLREIYKGRVSISVPQWSSETFKLYYTGQSCTWKMNPQRTIATITIKFDEPNPNDR